MSAGQDQEGRSAQVPADDGLCHVDAREAQGVLVGEHGTQVNYFFNGTWTDGVASPPLVGASGTITSPYRGLGAFEERDAGLFFGREAAAAQVLKVMSQCLEGPGLLVVSGVSGAGKSSLLRAGVLSQFRDSGLKSAPEAASWPCLVFTPGPGPLEELAVRIAPLAGANAATIRRELAADPAGFALTARAAALADLGSSATQGTGRPGEPGQRRLLLVVDQCEQLFTQCEAEGERQAFLAALHAAATSKYRSEQLPPAVVVLVVRADFEARLADHPQLASAVQDRYLLTQMTERQLQMAITQPALAAGSSVDDDLVRVLLGETHTRIRGPQPGFSAAAMGAGVLPLLSHALDQAWRRRTGTALTLADYERTGGIEGAIADSAQRAYNRLTPAQQAAARQVFTRLTATSSDGVNSAMRAARADLMAGKSDAQVRDVVVILETFAAERLLTIAAATVEISHEALLTAWPLLRDTWLAETHADRLVRTRLHATSDEWIRASRDPSYLYTGSMLEAAIDTAARIKTDGRHTPLSPAENGFLHASVHADRRRARRRQVFTATLLALVTGLAAVAFVAARANQATARQRNIAISRQLVSQSLALGQTNATVSALESIAAWTLDSSPQARYAVLAAAARPQTATLSTGTRDANSVAFSPDGKILAVGTREGMAELWDLATARQIGKPLTAGAGSTLESVTFSPDGKILATGGADGTVRLWNVSSHRQIGNRLTSTNHEDAETIAFSPDGKMLAIASANMVRLWNVATRQPIGRPFGVAVGSIAFSPDGKLLATGSDNAVRLWDVSTHRQIGTAMTSTATGVFSLAFSPDGAILAAGTTSSSGRDLMDGAVQLWKVATRRQIGGPFADNAGPVSSVAFSSNGTTVATGSASGNIQLWNTATRQMTGFPLAGNAGPVSDVAFSPGGTTLASATLDGTARLWNVALATGSQIGGSLNAGTPLPLEVLSIPVAFSPDGQILATGTNGGAIAGSIGGKLWNVTTHRQIGGTLNGGPNGFSAVVFSPDGNILATGDNGGTARLWSVATRRQIGKTLADATSSMGGVLSEAFSPDGTILATFGSGNRLRLWDVATHQEIGSFAADGGPGSAGVITAMAFGPDGKTLALVNGENRLRLWDVATHQEIGSFAAGRAPNSGGIITAMAFSPDGKTLALGGSDATVQLWDVATHQLTGSPLTGGTVNNIEAIAFSPDGTTLAAGSGEGAVQLWDVANQQQIGSPLTGGTRGISSISFSPDGKILATGSGDGAVRLWDVDYLTDALARLCAQVGGSLTRNEWAQYVPPGPSYRNVCP
jgi:WD40 repeat protein